MYVDIFGDIRESKTEDRSFLKKKRKRKRNTKKGRNKFETQRRRICF